MHKIIFFPEKKELKKYVCLPFLKLSDPLPETHLFFYLALLHMRNHHSFRTARTYTYVPMKAKALLRLRMSADPSEHSLLVNAI